MREELKALIDQINSDPGSYPNSYWLTTCLLRSLALLRIDGERVAEDYLAAALGTHWRETLGKGSAVACDATQASLSDHPRGWFLGA